MPRASTVHRKNLVIQAYLDNHLSVTAACKAAEIDRVTFYAWMDKDPEFKRVIDSQLEGLLECAEGNIYKKVREGDICESKYVLERLKKDKWAPPKTQIGLDGPVQIEVIRKVMAPAAGEPNDSNG